MKQIILVGALMLLSLGAWIILSKKTSDGFGEASGWTMLAGVVTIAFTVWFAIYMVGLSTEPASTRSDIREHEAFRNTVNQQRKLGVSDLEKVQLTQKIIEQNQWLAREQFWATNPWTDVFYDRAILDVKPIE